MLSEVPTWNLLRRLCSDRKSRSRLGQLARRRSRRIAVSFFKEAPRNGTSFQLNTGRPWYG